MNSDCMLIVYTYIGAIQTLLCRRVCKEWMSLVDSQTQTFWKDMYKFQVGWNISVSEAFDWKNTLVDIEKSLCQIEAFCTWNDDKVKVMSPWVTSTSNLIENDFVQVGFDLISGVTRDVYVTTSTCGSQLSYIYDNAFELKAVRKTCRRRNMSPCKKCIYKKTCDKQGYEYFIRKLSHPKVNDFLCRRITLYTPSKPRIPDHRLHH